MSYSTLKDTIHEIGLSYHKRIKRTPIKRFSNCIHSKNMRQCTSIIKIQYLSNEDILIDFDEMGWDGNPKNSKGWIPRMIFILFNIAILR